MIFHFTYILLKVIKFSQNSKNLFWAYFGLFLLILGKIWIFPKNQAMTGRGSTAPNKNGLITSLPLPAKSVNYPQVPLPLSVVFWNFPNSRSIGGGACTVPVPATFEPLFLCLYACTISRKTNERNLEKVCYRQMNKHRDRQKGIPEFKGPCSKVEVKY